ncbi:cytochrome P450 [Infundibulicybe gibba]|nr:cytochrome P450 [Infundibulicybe gibba]
MLNNGFELVRKNMRDGTEEPSILGSLLEVNDANGGSTEHEDTYKSFSATAYAAGADTTVSAVATFFYAMAINPDVQWKAQKKIDAVIGNDRLPESGDRPSLPWRQSIGRSCAGDQFFHWGCRIHRLRMMSTRDISFQRDRSSLLISGMCTSDRLLF